MITARRLIAAGAGLATALGLAVAVPAVAAGAPSALARPTFTVTTLVSGLTIPWDVAQTPDGTLLFDQRSGGLSVRRTDGTVAALSADFSDLFNTGETGVMGLVLDPGFAGNRRFYTCQGHQAGNDREIQVIAWTVDTAYTAATRVADPLLGDIPVNASIGRHGGCRLRFDATGSLMVGTGDNAVGTFPQDLTSLAGKVLRIDPMTGGPAVGNPAFNNPNPTTRLLWNYGHRNIQGLALRPNGQMYSVEHGSYRDDEVNLVLRARNYGWDPVNSSGGGYNEAVPMTDLVKFPTAKSASWSSGDPTIATSGATFLVGPQWKSWNGSLVAGVLADTGLLRLTFTGNGTLTSEEMIPEFDDTYGRIRTAQLGTDGSLYLTTSNGGGSDVILKVTPTG